MPGRSSSRISELARHLRGIPIHTDPVYRIAYGYDAAGVRGSGGGVAFPRGLDELASLLAETSRRGIEIFPRGAGTGFSGGSVPRTGGLVVSTERMARLLRFDTEREEAEVEAGMVNGELQEYLESSGYFFPPDPASLNFSTIGGNIAENSGGPRAFKYGVTRRYVRSLTWVTPAGVILSSSTEGPASLVVGSEGTLGVIYSAGLSVLPLPEARRTSMLRIAGDVGAVGAALELLSSGSCPSVLEYIDSKTMGCVSEYCNLADAGKETDSLFVEFDGSHEETEEQQKFLERFCRSGKISLTAAGNEEEREALWEVRRSISPSLARRGITKVNEDVSIPLGRLEEAVSSIGDLARELSLECFIFGHCGDGNLHVNIMTDRRRLEEMRRVEEFVERLFILVVSLGGTLSGEHGIGVTKKRYLGILFSGSEIAFQARLKEAMDPKLLLNPGKCFVQ